MEFYFFLFVVAILGLCKLFTEFRLDNYDTSKIDSTKLTHDVASGVSVAERRRRCVNGYYDKK